MVIYDWEECTTEYCENKRREDEEGGTKTILVSRKTEYAGTITTAMAP